MVSLSPFIFFIYELIHTLSISTGSLSVSSFCYFINYPLVSCAVYTFHKALHCYLKVILFISSYLTPRFINKNEMMEK